MFGFIAEIISKGFLFFALHIKKGNSFPAALSAKEEKEYLMLFKQGDQNAKNILIEHNLRLVAHVIKKYCPNPNDQDDLISIGTIGLIKAVNTFDGAKGIKLATYASKCIENTILTSNGLISDCKKTSDSRRHSWQIISNPAKNFYILCKTDRWEIRCAPMYIHSFKVISPHRISEAIKFNQQYHKYEDVPNLQDKLRWCRYHMGLSQKEVADLVGINRSVYMNYENGKIGRYKKEIVDKLARLYNVPADDFLDDYSRFLYYGQKKSGNILRLRKTENK